MENAIKEATFNKWSLCWYKQSKTMKMLFSVWEPKLFKAPTIKSQQMSGYSVYWFAHNGWKYFGSSYTNRIFTREWSSIRVCIKLLHACNVLVPRDLLQSNTILEHTIRLASTLSQVSSVNHKSEYILGIHAFTQLPLSVSHTSSFVVPVAPRALCHQLTHLHHQLLYLEVLC